MMGPGMFDSKEVDRLLRFLGCTVILLVAFLPLGVWKFVELLVWFCSHLRWETMP